MNSFTSADIITQDYPFLPEIFFRKKKGKEVDFYFFAFVEGEMKRNESMEDLYVSDFVASSFCFHPVPEFNIHFLYRQRHNKLNFDGKQAAAKLSNATLFSGRRLNLFYEFFLFFPHLFETFFFNYTSWHLCCVLRRSVPFFPSQTTACHQFHR
jgi:hypothetical protein